MSRNIGEVFFLEGLGIFAAVTARYVSGEPIEVLLGTVEGKDVSMRVEGIPFDTSAVYIGYNESMHAHGLPRRRGHSYAFVCPTQHDIALVLFENADEEVWYEGFAPLLDNSWDHRRLFAYRNQRLQLLRTLKMARAQEAHHG